MVTQVIANVDLGTQEILPAAVAAVGDGDGVDDLPMAQVHLPPWLQLFLGAGAGAELPVSISIPIHGVGGQAEHVQGGRLGHAATPRHVGGWKDQEGV